MKILKFGGSSLAGADNIRRAARIILKTQDRLVIIVVSAFQGVTDQLLECARAAEKGDRTYRGLSQQIAARHLSVVADLLDKCMALDACRKSAPSQSELDDALHGIELLRHSLHALSI